jgi:hypothetical protein
MKISTNPVKYAGSFKVLGGIRDFFPPGIVSIEEVVHGSSEEWIIIADQRPPTL